MESEYEMFVNAERASYRGNELTFEAAEAAVKRLQAKCRDGRTFVEVHIKNPRFKGWN